jgi:membrane protease YdiL (CAAX protease family)
VVPTGIFADEAVYHLHRFHPRIFSTEIIDYANSLFSSAPLLSLIALGIAISIGPAIGEELMFRGALLQTFRRDMPAGWAVLYSSILFGAIHFDWMQGTAAGIIGLYLGCVTVWSRSIYPAMTAHFFNNLLAVLLARTGTFGLSEAALTGYPLPVLIAAAPILLFVMYLLYRCRVQ